MVVLQLIRRPDGRLIGCWLHEYETNGVIVTMVTMEWHLCFFALLLCKY